MATRVSTGGTKSFQYDKGHNPTLDSEGKTEIREAYAQANERKRKEKFRRNMIITIALLILIILSFAIIF